jgi:hypothetical protein
LFSKYNGAVGDKLLICKNINQIKEKIENILENPMVA